MNFRVFLVFRNFPKNSKKKNRQCWAKPDTFHAFLKVLGSGHGVGWCGVMGFAGLSWGLRLTFRQDFRRTFRRTFRQIFRPFRIPRCSEVEGRGEGRDGPGGRGASENLPKLRLTIRRYHEYLYYYLRVSRIRRNVRRNFRRIVRRNFRRNVCRGPRVCCPTWVRFGRGIVTCCYGSF
jgi:hypothetical protein